MERGFDKLMTPMGLMAVVGALFLFFLVCAAGGVWWRLAEQAKRQKATEASGPTPSAEGSPSGK